MTTDTVEIYKAKKVLRKRTQWRWRYVRSNGKKLADSAESYANIADLLGSLATVIGIPEVAAIGTDVTREFEVNLFERNGTAVQVVVKR